MTEWTKAEYFGDSVRLTVLTRGNETGDIRIQEMDPGVYRIGVFLPGRVVENHGDSRKVEPERATWCNSKQGADNFFDRYLSEAEAQGWRQP